MINIEFSGYEFFILHLLGVGPEDFEMGLKSIVGALRRPLRFRHLRDLCSTV